MYRLLKKKKSSSRRFDVLTFLIKVISLINCTEINVMFSSYTGTQAQFLNKLKIFIEFLNVYFELFNFGEHH